MGGGAGTDHAVVEVANAKTMPPATGVAAEVRLAHLKGLRAVGGEAAVEEKLLAADAQGEGSAEGGERGCGSAGCWHGGVASTQREPMRARQSGAGGPRQRASMRDER